jgi:hypothetical protein
MKKIKLAIIVFILLNCLSCSRNNLPDNPDAQLRSIKGTLRYNSFFDRWNIDCHVSTDTVEIFAVRNYLPKESGNSKQVQATGICTQTDDILYVLHDNLPPLPEFICYYIDVIYLKYE